MHSTITRSRIACNLEMALLLAGAALGRFWALSTESLWFDESYSVWVARHSVGWHVALSTQRIFPPLYYLCLHFWLALGESEFIVRSLSAGIGLTSVLVIYLLARQLFDKRVGFLSAVLLAVSPLHVWYSQEARMYILVAGLGLCSAYFVWLAVREGRGWHWLAYVLSTALLMNAHYFAIFLVPFQNAFVLYWLLRRQARKGLLWQWCLCQSVVALLSLVGLAGIISAESSYWWGVLDTWHGAPGMADLLGLMFSFSLGNTVRGRWVYWGGMLLFGSCVLWGLFAVGRHWFAPRWRTASGRKGTDAHAQGRWREMDGLVFTVLYLLVPLGLVFVLSQVQSFWVQRYVFPFLPPYCILVGLGISKLPRRLDVVFASLIVLLSLWPLANIYSHEQKENWRDSVRHIETQEQVGDLILLVDEDIWLPFEHYYRGSIRRVGISRGIKDRELVAARIAMLLPDHDRVWLVLSHTDNWVVRDVLRASEYAELVSETEYTGIEVNLFAISLDGSSAPGLGAPAPGS